MQNGSFIQRKDPHLCVYEQENRFKKENIYLDYY